MKIGGLDVGTTGCKLSVYDSSGEFICNSYREYEVNRKKGEHEIDAEEILSAVFGVIRDSAEKCKLDAIGVTTFGESFVVLDENNKVLLPSMLYTDPRGEKECEELIDKLGEKRIISIAGVKPHSMYSLPKMMWIRSNLPEVYRKIKRILLMEDYIIYMLTGNAVIDYSLAARTMAFDIREKCWSDELLNAAGIDKELLSNPVPAFNIAGELNPELAGRLGITNTVKIVNGAHDQVAAAVGAGVLESGNAVDGTGTVECVTPVFDNIPDEERLYKMGYSVVPYVFDGTYVCYALSYTGGAAVKWFRDNLSSGKTYRELDSEVKDEPTRLLVLPHFSGAANPYMDSGSKAALLGLTFEHSGADIYKALMEGVTYEIMINIEQLESFGIKPEKLFATGGGSASGVWLQIKADILGRPVTALESRETGACGTCMMVGVALGIFESLYEAKDVFVRVKKVVYPDPERSREYRKLYGAYKKIYTAVREVIRDVYDE